MRESPLVILWKRRLRRVVERAIPASRRAPYCSTGREKRDLHAAGRWQVLNITGREWTRDGQGSPHSYASEKPMFLLISRCFRMFDNFGSLGYRSFEFPRIALKGAEIRLLK